MQTRTHAKAGALLGILASLSLAITSAAEAGIFYDIELKGTYETNVVGLLSDNRGGSSGMSASAGPGMSNAMGGNPNMGGHGSNYTGSSSSTSNSDTSIDLSADLGNSWSVADDTNVFLAGSAERANYSSFTEFNATIGGLSAGVQKGFGNSILARFAVNGAVKRYGDSQRDSSAYGAVLKVKEQLGPSFWLREGYAYEKNSADSALFSYNGNGVNIWAGFLVAPQTTVLAGYNYLVRDFDEPVGFKITAQTLSLGLEQGFTKNWFLDAQYDHQASDSNEAGTSATDNVLSLGLRYSY